ncbi:EamA family transporter [Paracoccus sp. S-4012]|nr:EamA family transporter [Paracoccus sp. S-4012]
MIATSFCFVAVNGSVRYLDGALPAPQAAFLRFAFGVVLVMPALLPALRAGFPARVWRLFAVRGMLHTAGTVLWFYAMARITIAEVTAIGFLNPILVTLGATLLLGERLSVRRALAIGAALIGALIVIRPGLRALDPGHGAQVLASVMFASSYLVLKRLTDLVPASVVVAMMSLTVAIGLAPLALAVWVPPTGQQLGWLSFTAAAATAGHYCMTRAFTAAPLVVTQPVTFLQLIWASLLGALVFAEPLDPFVILGGAVMIGAISYITWRESRRAPVPVTPPPEATRLP